MGKKVIERGYTHTKVKDRKYFTSIYFFEPGGILIELATRGPGMTIDEDLENLGEAFIIPEKYSENHEVINKLMPIEVREVDKLEDYGYRDKFEYELLQNKRKILDEIKEIKSKENIIKSDRKKIEDLKNKYLNKEYDTSQ